MKKFFGRVLNGQKQYYKPTEYAEHLKTLETREFEEIIQERFVDTTTDQHGYYRSVNRWLIDNTEKFGGYNEDDLHELALELFATYTKAMKVGTKIVQVRIKERTRDMGKRRMARFMTEWFAWLATEEITVPSSEEMIIGKYKTITT